MEIWLHAQTQPLRERTRHRLPEGGGSGIQRMDGQEMDRIPPSERSANPFGVSEATTKRYFGPGLALMRETFSARTMKEEASGPIVRARPTARAVVDCLRGLGYSISAATYSEIEGG